MNMPKMKTHRATAKRVSLTGTGKLKRNRMNRRHLLDAKTTKRKRNLRKATEIDATSMKAMRKVMPYA